jgi:hypothetical protein
LLCTVCCSPSSALHTLRLATCPALSPFIARSVLPAAFYSSPRLPPQTACRLMRLAIHFHYDIARILLCGTHRCGSLLDSVT